MQIAHPIIQKIYDLLESGFCSLDLCSRLNPLLDELSTMKFSAANSQVDAKNPIKSFDFEMYIPGLKQLGAMRTLEHISKVLLIYTVSRNKSRNKN